MRGEREGGGGVGGGGRREGRGGREGGKDSFDGDYTTHLFSQFSSKPAHTFFSEAYRSSVHRFEAPSCLPTSAPPQKQMCVSANYLGSASWCNPEVKSISTSSP